MPIRSAAKRLRLAALAAPPPQQSARAPEVAVAEVAAHAVREPGSGRAYVLVKLRTNTGVVGWGETHARPDPATAVANVLRWRERLTGLDALASETARLRLADAPPGVRAAVDMALLDIKGRIAKAPVYDLLSGRTRDKARAVAALGRDADLAEARTAGFRAFSVRVDVPEGPVRGRTFYADTMARCERLRRDGDDLALDCDGRTSAAEAAVLAERFERFHLLWLDEPTAEINHEALRKISDRTVTPLGWGRNVTDNARFQDLLRMQVVDVLRFDIALHGVSSARRAAALAEAYYTAVAPFARGGPLGTAAALHVAASTPNFFALDVPFAADERDRRMRRELVSGADLERATGGYLALPPGPGLGVEIDEGAVRRYAA